MSWAPCPEPNTDISPFLPVSVSLYLQSPSFMHLAMLRIRCGAYQDMSARLHSLRRQSMNASTPPTHKRHPQINLQHKSLSPPSFLSIYQSLPLSRPHGCLRCAELRAHQDMSARLHSHRRHSMKASTPPTQKRQAQPSTRFSFRKPSSR